MLFGKKAIAFLSATALLLFQSSCGQGEKIQAPPAVNSFSAQVLKVGQADAIVLNTKNSCIIIDCGEKGDGEEMAKYLNKNGIDCVDYMFITHFDKDHVGGVPELLDKIPVKKIIVPNYVGTNDEYSAYISKTNELNIVPEAITKEMKFILDDVLFEIYPPQKASYSESDNDFSLAISVTHGENSFLFTGDAEAERIDEVINQCGSKYDFLKIPHHGKYNKNTKKLLDTINPTFAVITDSKKKFCRHARYFRIRKIGM